MTYPPRSLREWRRASAESQANHDRRTPPRDPMRAVYWRRRSVALAVLAVVAFAAGFAVSQLA
jgi:hypothetical protein